MLKGNKENIAWHRRWWTQGDTLAQGKNDRVCDYYYVGAERKAKELNETLSNSLVEKNVKMPGYAT